jgi:hypothetical protein
LVLAPSMESDSGAQFGPHVDEKRGWRTNKADNTSWQLGIYFDQQQSLILASDR